MNHLEIFAPDDWMQLMSACSQSQEYLLKAVLDLKYDLERSHHHTIIRSISSRLKSMDSLINKLKKLNQPVTPAAASLALHDIIGIRIICSYLCDIDTVLVSLRSIPYLQILEIKDYINFPKESGYRSLHVIGCCSVTGENLLCEFQLRTTAMDSWAALEHQLRYKQNRPDSEFVNRELLDCSNLLYETDLRMERIHHHLKEQED